VAWRLASFGIQAITGLAWDSAAGTLLVLERDRIVELEL
jgi:hypothetical protein